MSSIIKVNEIQDGGGNTIIKTDGSGDVTNSIVGVNECSQFYCNAEQTISSGNTPTTITGNWSSISNASTSYEAIGTEPTESSGVWTLPRTGKYIISGAVELKNTATTNSRYAQAIVQTTTDNSTYNNTMYSTNNFGSETANQFVFCNFQTFFDCTDTSTHKIRLQAAAAVAVNVGGNSTQIRTNIMFMRIGDT